MNDLSLPLNYLTEPENESCYEYLLGCYGRIKADVGEYPAFVSADCKTSMSLLVEHIEKLAAYLTANGFSKDDVMTVFLPTSAHVFPVFYALNKIGVIVNFVHPLTPPDGLLEILKNTKSRGLFILDRAVGAFSDIAKDTFTVVCSMSDYADGAVKDMLLADEKANVSVPSFDSVHRFSDIIAGEYEKVPTVKDCGRDTAVYMHGSGTTGKSKTVKLSSFALNSVAYKQYFVDKYHEYGKSYSLCVLPCFHAFGLGASVHYCLCNGYSCIVMPKFDAEKANDFIKRYNVQYISGAPAMFSKMFAAPNFVNEGLKNLTVLYSGGDIVSESFIEKFNGVLAENGSRGRLFRGWGLTEMCAVCATNSHVACRADSIGPVLHGLDVAVFDDDHRKLPFGEVGEIALSGETMMNGYLDDGAADDDGIWTDADGREWICTGDMGYVDEDGFVFFTGRKKRIIIISGYNIYPYSIEQSITSLPYINEACAVQGYDENGRSVIKLCVSLNDTPLAHDEIRADIIDFCTKTMNRFSVPRKVEFLDKLPRTKMDKLDFMTMSDPVPMSK